MAMRAPKATHGVDYSAKEVVDKTLDNRNMDGIEDKVIDVKGRVVTVGDVVKAIDEKVTAIDSLSAQHYFHSTISGDLRIFSESQTLHSAIHSWLSPPDSTQNHNTVCETRQKGASKWFFQSKAFGEWNSRGSLLWIHGKRIFVLLASLLECSRSLIFTAGSGKSVLWFVFFGYLSKEGN